MENKVPFEEYPMQEDKEKEDLIPKTAEEEAEEEEDYSKALKSISPSRIAIAVLIGLAVVVYLFIREFKFHEFEKISWNGHVFFWLGMACIFVCTRHLSYMARLRIVTDKFFSWKKCFELILMWEFSSAVTPTSVGGSAVAMVALSQEKLPPGRTAMLVLYTVIADTFFFLSTLLFFFLIFGPIMVQPDSYSLSHLLGESKWGIGFFTAYLFMFTYGSIFFYGVFVNAKGLQKFLLWLTSFKWLNRFQKAALKMTKDMDAASSELRKKKWSFHLRTFLATMGAWSSKFMVLNCLIIAFVSMSNDPSIQEHYNDLMRGTLQFNEVVQQFFIYARQLAMYIIMAILPTPGGSGAAEAAFTTFHSDYIPKEGTLLLILAVFWRFFTYYIYLFVGMIVVPNWIRNIINRRKKEALEKQELNAIND